MPVITDPETDEYMTASPGSAAGIKAKNRYTHAGETVRAYCQESALTLVAVVCASRAARRPVQRDLPTPAPSPPRTRARVKFIDDLPVLPPENCSLTDAASSNLVQLLHPLQPGALALTDEHTLISLYRANVIEPIAMIRELRDLLSASAVAGKGRSRIIFVNGNEALDSGLPRSKSLEVKMQGAMQVVGTARRETAKLLRSELGPAGIDVCEVVVGRLEYGGADLS